MVAEIREHSGEIRGVTVTWVDVIVAGHTVEQVLSYDVAEAEAVHGAPFSDKVDEIMQMGMFAIDRISADGTMRAAAATSYVLDGRCIRTAKIRHCSDIEPISAGWIVTRPDGTRAPRRLWSCVPGMPPSSHDDLPREDEVTRFLRMVAEHSMTVLFNDDLRPDRDTRAAISLGYGYRGYNLWYSRTPWSLWDMAYRMTLRKRDDNDEDDTGSLWAATIGFTYLIEEGTEALEARLQGVRIHERQSVRTDEVEEEDGQISRIVVTEVSLESDELDDAFANALSDVLTRFIENVTPVVEEHERFRDKTGDEAVYEMLVLTGTGERVGGFLTWNRREGTWSYETSDPLISRVLEEVMARGFANMRESIVTEYSIAEALVPVGPDDRRFLTALTDTLERSHTRLLEIREVTGGLHG